MVKHSNNFTFTLSYLTYDLCLRRYVFLHGYKNINTVSRKGYGTRLPWPI